MERKPKTVFHRVCLVADLNRGIIALGGELHADAEAVLIQDGSAEKDLWGINIYPFKKEDEWIVYTSLINVRPSLGNYSLEIASPQVREKIKKIVCARVS